MSDKELTPARQARREDTKEAMLDCLRNGGGDVIRKILKEENEHLGLFKDEAQELRKDFNWVRQTRKSGTSPDSTGSTNFTLFGFTKNELTIIGLLILIFGVDKVTPIITALLG